MATPTWDESLGSNNWEGLLDPLDSSLRGFILQCGGFSEAAYDTFNSDVYSNWCGSSRYGKKDFFKKVKLEPAESVHNYQVESFLYATPGAAAAATTDFRSLIVFPKAASPWDKDSNWMGYIAVTTDEISQATGRRDIYVVWRGTARQSEIWEVDLKFPLEPAKPLFQPAAEPRFWVWDKDPRVMSGWLKLYEGNDPTSLFTSRSARSQLNIKMKEIIEKYKGQKLSVVVTGHSLGGALSVISAFDLVENGVISSEIPVAVIAFAAPQVGNGPFKKALEKHSNLKVLQIRNSLDIIPKCPGLPLPLAGYVDVGIGLEIDSRKSPFLKELSIFTAIENEKKWHNLEAMLHIVAGWNGAKGEFQLQVNRSLALVNKSLDFLKDEYFIPVSWWVENNKGLVRNEETGEWALAEPAPEDIPVPEQFP